MYTIGYAISSKKQQSFIKPSLLSLASSRGLNLIPIDPSLPISSQSPHFHLILHKLYHHSWISNLHEFSSNDPAIPIVDPPELIEKLQNRISMLQFVSQLRIPSNRELNTDLSAQYPHPTFGNPKQLIVQDEAALADPAIFSSLKFPIITKPLFADGSTGSHNMALVFGRAGLLKQEPPVVLQEFVNHGGVVFKVYVVGDYVKCVKRTSLPDISHEKVTEFAEVGSVPFSQISNTTVAQDAMSSVHSEEAEMPPDCFVTEIARGLRSAMGLHLFNFDMIKDATVRNHYLVIDINYFPGYEKLPDYETIFTDFLWSMVHKEKLEGSGSSSGNGDGKQKPLCSVHYDSGEEVENVG